MALAADGSLNIKKLQKEMVEALDEDVKYVKTDEMKKRAIRTARTYDEFKNLVACACLKPVSREDIESLSKTKKGWATARNKKYSGAKQGAKAAAAELNAPAGQPRSAMEFERDWRRIGSDTTKRLRVLSVCGPSFIEEQFKVEMDAVLLGEVIEALHTTLTTDQPQSSQSSGEALPPPPPSLPSTKVEESKKDRAIPPPPPSSKPGGEKGVKEEKSIVPTSLTIAETGRLMLALTKTGRFSLNKRFLSDIQVRKAKEIVEALGGHMVQEEMVRLTRAYCS